MRGRFLWRDWLNEINGLLSIFTQAMERTLDGCYFCRLIHPAHLKPLCETVTQSCEEVMQISAQIFTFSPFTCPWLCQSFNLSPVCFWCFECLRTVTCFVFDLLRPRFGLLGIWIAFFIFTIKISAIDSQRISQMKNTLGGFRGEMEK